MKPPAYVSIVLPPSVRIKSLDAVAKASVVRAGLTLRRDSFLYPAVHFADSPGELLSNDSFVDTFARLNDAGIAFGEDYKQGWAPAHIMRELQSRGRITAPFTAIAWRGPDDWFTTVHGHQPTNA